ncbi:hypothetical protein KCV87_10485 [Actinosynnema pretiosum subsp. pretiosum]|uniref:Uncharacterized protein n=2 Tax=Actinosynnema TaxID=40566 RepID=C6WFE9_ACTMD|nr:hypothetical protein [Actinosynnema mirum]ACU35884.1 hypothetical protein Amir_1936 [Actinosynnema mirum DSM 43827]AXX29308.1 hypothetical protein APASM_1943 [Actinosynnema pretiosum subsp. pretiosum]QUF06436.1 hypothetical protein KCV87_10485 [Actinosynnema pretiosum subsp. pretiosum]
MATRAHTAVSATRYLDAVLDTLRGAGVDVLTLAVDIRPCSPVRAELVTDVGPLRWSEDLGWSAGSRALGPVAHPGEVARLVLRSAEPRKFTRKSKQNHSSD